MQTPILKFPVCEDNMPLNETDKAWIRQEIQAAHKRRGWRRITGWIKDWSLTGAALAILIFVSTRWEAYTEFRVHTEDRLNQIEKGLLDINHQLFGLSAVQNPKEALKQMGEFDAKTLAKSLPILRRIAEQPISEVKPNPEILTAVAYKLRSIDESSPDYWPTVLRFIQFASEGISPTGVPPHGRGTVLVSSHQSTVDFSGGIITRAVAVFDGGNLLNGHFVRCRIVFTNDPVHMRNVTFTDCVFEMPATDTPNPLLKQTVGVLLASNFKSVSIENL